MEHPPYPSFRELLRDRRIQIALALGLGLRLLFIVLPGSHFGGDGPEYAAIGVNAVLHGTFASVCDRACIPTLLRTPGYPLLLGVVLGLFKLPVLAVHLLQAALDLGTTLLAAMLGRIVGGIRVAVLAAFIYALNPFAAAFVAQVASESLAAFLLVLAVYVLWRVRSADGGGRPMTWFALGL
ncbi:MAG: hypothetical protein JOZ69_15455, partial [Myxococcales bacterium]|nr:hypothetical protein [Myxococcales bacterium]